MANLNLKSEWESCHRAFSLILIASVFVTGCVVVTGSSLFAQEPSLNGELTWKNGDKLPGHVVSSDGTHLKWQSELFRDSLEIDLGFLDRIKLDSNTLFGKTAETYAIQTVDGFSLYGEVKKLDDKALVVSSKRFGEVSVDRSKIATLLNLKTSGSLINGEFDLSQWGANRDEKKYWKVNEQGELESLRSNVHLFLKSELPESALIEVELEWEKKLDFTFGFGVPKSSRKIELLPRLESWDDAVVLSYNDDFEIVLESNESESKRLKFLIHWNRVTNQLVIHDERGKILATADLGKQPTSIEPGIYLENKSGDLRVTSLMIRRSTKGFDATAPSIQTLDDSAINGRVKSFDGVNWQIEKAKAKEAKEADESDSIVSVGRDDFCGAFLMNPPEKRPSGQSRVKYHDGMYVRGKLISIDGSKIALTTNLSSESVELDLAGAMSVQFETPESESVSTFSHRLFNKVGQIQGKLESGSGAADDIMRWRVAGAKSAVPFSQGDGRIVLQDNKPTEKIKNRWADTLYLANRDTVPCRIVSMDENQITVESFFDNDTIDQALIKAVDFRNQEVAERVELDDPDWSIPEASKKRVKVGDKHIQLSSKAELGHPWLFAGGGFEFELSWKNNLYGVLECRTLVGDLESGEGGKKVNVMLYGENVFVANEGEPNPNTGMVSVKNGKAKIAFKYQKGKLEVTVNGKKAYSEKVASNSNRGRGVKFKLNDMYQQGIKCELRNFKLQTATTGNSSMVDAEQKKLLLTIPRLKKLRPPKQILCANNLDMLRGELISMNHEHVTFRANNEVKMFPREVVSSVVWLHADGLAKSEFAAEEVSEDQVDDSEDSNADSKVEADSTEVSTLVSKQQQTVQVLMRGNRRMTTTLNSWAGGKLSGDSEALGSCDIPFDQIYELRFGSFATKATDIAYSDWVAELAPSPKMETGADGQPGSGFTFGSASPLIGTRPKPFSISTVDGKQFSLKEEVGKVVVLDFWATWCGPCVQALPKIRDTVAKYSSDEVVLIAINQEETKDQIRSFLESRNLEIPVGLDSGTIGRQFKADSLPTTVVINPNGEIAFVKVGSSNDMEEKLAAAIDELLKADREAVK